MEKEKENVPVLLDFSGSFKQGSSFGAKRGLAERLSRKSKPGISSRTKHQSTGDEKVLKSKENSKKIDSITVDMEKLDLKSKSTETMVVKENTGSMMDTIADALFSGDVVPLEEEEEEAIEAESKLNSTSKNSEGGMQKEFNIAYVAAQLNPHLSSLGYRQIECERSDEISQEDAFVTLFENIFGDFRDLGARLKKVESDSIRERALSRRLECEKEKLGLKLKLTNQDLMMQNSKMVVLQKANKKQKTQYDAWMKELQVTIFKLEGQHKQRQAAANKRETEYERLRKRMQMLQAQKDKTIKRSIEAEHLPVPHSSSNQKYSQKILEEQLEEMEKKMENTKINQLLAENEKLRKSLESIHKSSLSTLEAGSHSQSIQAENCTTSSPSCKEKALVENLEEFDLSDECFNLPADTLCDRLEKLQVKVSKLLEEKQNNDSNRHDIDTDTILRSLSQAKQIIIEQDELLKASLFSGNNSGDDIQTMEKENMKEDLLEEQAEIEREMLMIRKSQERLKVDHDLLIKEAEKLDQERTKFEEERFEERIRFRHSEVNSFSSQKAQKPKKPEYGGNSTIRLPIPPTPATKSLLQNIGATDSPFNTPVHR